MFIQLALYWGLLLTLLKITNIVACSWYLIWLPLPISFVISICVLMYIQMLFTGSVKFWK